MFLEETPEQQALRTELRAYYAELLTPEIRAGLADGGEGGVMWRKVISRIGADGWLGIGWPKEVGGQGRPATDQFIFFDETRRAGAPFPFVTINTVGPTMMIYGTEEQKKFFLPGILSGEINFAIGYTEPEAGTDLASLRTRAVRDGDEYVINGNKIFTSGADQADFIWLAVRTDPDAPKHKGISIVCVPTSSPGFSYSIITTVGGLTTSASYYSDVHVPVANRIGEENEGWRMITTQLNHERVGIAAWAGYAREMWNAVARWTAETKIGHEDGSSQKMLDLPWVRNELARTHAELKAMYLLKLAHGRGRRRRHAHAGSIVGSQGVRDRAHDRGLQAASRDRWFRRLPRTGLAGRGDSGTAGAERTSGPDQHLRRWRERSPARDRRDCRPRSRTHRPVMWAIDGG